MDATAAEELVLTLITTLVEQINNVMAAFADAHPEIVAPSNLYSVPDLSWTAELLTPELIDLEVVPAQAGLVVVENGVREWRAASGKNGDATVWIQPSRDPEAIALELGIVDYDGGAFGEDIVASPQRVLKVRMPLTTEIESASTIAEGGINAVSVLVLREVSPGNKQVASGVTVQLKVIGGTLTSGIGTTDAAGQFVTTVSPLPGSNQVEISATVSDPWNEAEAERSIAVTPVGGEVFLSNISFFPPGGGLVECTAFAGEGQEFRSDPPLGDVKPAIDPDVGVHQTWSCSVTDPTTEVGVTAQSSAQVTLDIDVVRDENSRVTLIDWRASSSIAGSTTPCDPGPGGGAWAEVEYSVRVEVTVQSQATVRVVGILQGVVSVEFFSQGGGLGTFGSSGGSVDLDEVAVLTPGQWVITLHETQREGGLCTEPFEKSFMSNLRLSFE